MSPRTSGDDCRNIVVADEDKAQLPYDVPILHEPFTADDLRGAVRPLPWA